MKLTLIFLAAALLARTGQAETPLDIANRGAGLFAAGDYVEAESCYRRALDLWPAGAEAAHGRAIVLGNLGNLLRTTGRFPEAEAALTQALGQLKAIGAPAVPNAGFVLDDLAVLYRIKGDLARAESSALAAASMVSDEEKPANRLVLASVFIEQGRSEEAEPLLRGIVDSDDARAACTANLGLAAAALSQGHFTQGEDYARRALALAQRSLPPNHPAIAMARNTLAQACRSQGRYLEAERAYREAIGIWEAAFGPDHPDLAKGLLGLAALYHERQRDAGAESLYRRAIRILDRSFGANGPQAMAARAELAGVLRGERRFTEAATLLAGSK